MGEAASIPARAQVVSALLTEVERGDVAPAVDDVAMFGELVDRGAVLVVDWSGEDEPGQIAGFVADRLRRLGAPAPVDTEVEPPPGLGRGEVVPAIVGELHRRLKPAGWSIVELDQGHDAYYLGVARLSSAEQLVALDDPFWRLRMPDSAPRDYLHVIDCPCGSMNVWQLGAREPAPDEGECERCGRNLFGADGAPLSSMSREAV